MFVDPDLKNTTDGVAAKDAFTKGVHIIEFRKRLKFFISRVI